MNGLRISFFGAKWVMHCTPRHRSVVMKVAREILRAAVFRDICPRSYVGSPDKAGMHECYVRFHHVVARVAAVRVRSRHARLRLKWCSSAIMGMGL